MLLAEQLIREGDLRGALQDLKDNIRKQPDNSKFRIFYFQLLTVLGQWERAFDQLGVIKEMDDEALAMVHIYREALHCEALRREVFAGRRDPLILGEPPGWIALSLQALKLSAQGNDAKAASLRDQAFEAANTVSGSIDGTPFQWIADGDSRLGPVLEVILDGKYYWVPFEQVRQIRLEKPQDLRDLIWLPGQATWVNGGQVPVLIPVRYPGSDEVEDSMIQLSRKTEWLEPAENFYVGLGQRMLVTDEGDHPLLDTRLIDFDQPAAVS